VSESSAVAGAGNGVSQASERRFQGVAPRPRRAGDFESSYDGTPPWDIGRPQPVFLDLANAGDVQGRVLDVGCGTGEHALMAADLGLAATGVDGSRTAIEKAEQKATIRTLRANFVVGNALDLDGLGEQFDTVIDSGLFHVFEDGDRAEYVASLARVIPPGGRYFMLCFSQFQPGDWGPRRVTEEEIRASFSGGWRVDSIDGCRMELTSVPAGVSAWLAKLTRT
jgi:cyclopropane fatty-acyl-phospholipid synthase-like methyltransferase